jgi:hypothetical protein
MALIKVIRVGDELSFNLEPISKEAKQQITITLVEKAGRMAVLKITADRSIPITHSKQIEIR